MALTSYGITALMSLSLLVTGCCYAAETTSSANVGWQLTSGQNATATISDNTPLNNQGFVLRAGLPFHDDITDDQAQTDVVLTKAERHQANVWNLSEAEEKRVVLLMKNRSGTYYNNKTVTPVMLLGINARSDKARAYYANKAAKQELQRIAKVLAFNTAYHHAAVQLQHQHHLPVLRPFDITPYSLQGSVGQALTAKLQPGDNMILFVRLDDAVRSIIAKLLRVLLQVPGSRLTVEFVGEHVTDSAIQQWARHQAIPVAFVTNHTITLKRNSQDYQRLQAQGGKRVTPALAVMRNNHLKRLSME